MSLNVPARSALAVASGTRRNRVVPLLAIALLAVACSNNKTKAGSSSPDAGQTSGAVDGRVLEAGLEDAADSESEGRAGNPEAGGLRDAQVDAATIRDLSTDSAAPTANQPDVDADAVSTSQPDAPFIGDSADDGGGRVSVICAHGCLIAGLCYPTGVSNPLNPCQICDPQRSLSAWSNNDGASCDDGKFCTVGDTCSAGVCAGGARNCSDGVTCNGVETCDEINDVCLAGANTCLGSTVCEHQSDKCVATCSGCVIGGVCYGDGQTNPANPCLKCDKLTPTVWSTNDRVPCDDGKFCTVGDTCSAGACAGNTRSCSDGIACNGVETCDESTDTCVAGSNTCVGGICDAISGSCVPQHIGSTGCSGCLIKGVCYRDGQANPANPCQRCAWPGNASAWSPNDGAPCNDGRFCTVDDKCLAGACAGKARVCDDGIACNGTEACDEVLNVCAAGSNACSGSLVCEVTSGQCVAACTGCMVQGICFPDGLTNPSNPCQTCDATASASGWTNKAEDTACDDGRYCSVGETCKAGKCEGSSRVCDDGVACNGEETCDEDRDVCAAGTPSCAAGTVCDHQSNQCIPTCPGCRIGGVCYGDGQSNPGNPCQTCDRASQDDDWTNKKTGDSCDDGLFCTVGDACDGAGACKGTGRACDDLIACNGKETCDESKDACVAGGTACPTDTLCDVATDRCVATCGGCVIDKKCYGSGQTNPENPCEECPQGVSATAWGKKLDGATCDDGVFCNGIDTCASGSCGHGGSPCDGGTSCVETKKACYLVGVALCNADGDVVTYDANGESTLVEDCVASSAHGTCAAGVCGCADGYSGDTCQSHAESCLVRVSTAGNDVNDGSTWALSVASVQRGLALAEGRLGTSVPSCEVWVASGTYKPTSGTDRAATFRLRANVALYGGFAGTEVARHARNAAANVTILSGDIGNAGNSDNSYHVVTGATNATIDGFTITDGNANSGSPYDMGGGMYNDGSSPTVIGCTFSKNYATTGGGGMYNKSSSPTITGCTFSENAASYPSMARVYGGGVFNENSSPVFTDCTFHGNQAYNRFFAYGGGIYNSASSPTLTNCVFFANAAKSDNADLSSAYGGAMYNSASSLPRIQNCTFSGNHADSFRMGSPAPPGPGHAYGGGISHDSSSSTRIMNSIFWADYCSVTDGQPTIFRTEPCELDGAVDVSNSIVQNGHPGTGNLDANPFFVDAAAGNLHLLSISPAIDQGASCGSAVPSTDREGNLRWDIASVVNLSGSTGLDLGAYEYQGGPGDLEVTALCQAPTSTTLAASSITTSSATLNGRGVPNGAATTGWFRLSTTDPGSCNDAFGTRIPDAGQMDLGSGVSAATYSLTATGLMANTTYYFCAIVSNSAGLTDFGSVLSFVTSAH